MACIDEIITDFEYRKFMLELSRQFTTQDTDELKFMLTSKLPAEDINTPLDVFQHLERLKFVGPNNLRKLARLFWSMGKERLYSMVTSYIFFTENDSSQVNDAL